MVFCGRKSQTIRTIDMIHNWLKKNKININKEKLGIMKIRLRRSKITEFNNRMSILAVNSYKYLRIIIDQSVKMKPQTQKSKRPICNYQVNESNTSQRWKQVDAVKIHFQIEARILRNHYQ